MAHPSTTRRHRDQDPTIKMQIPRLTDPTPAMNYDHPRRRATGIVWTSWIISRGAGSSIRASRVAVSNCKDYSWDLDELLRVRTQNMTMTTFKLSYWIFPYIPSFYFRTAYLFIYLFICWSTLLSISNNVIICNPPHYPDFRASSCVFRFRTMGIFLSQGVSFSGHAAIVPRKPPILSPQQWQMCIGCHCSTPCPSSDTMRPPKSRNCSLNFTSYSYSLRAFHYVDPISRMHLRFAPLAELYVYGDFPVSLIDSQMDLRFVFVRYKYYGSCVVWY